MRRGPLAVTLHRWTAGAEAAGRLDRYVAARLGLSRSRAAALVVAGDVLVDGRVPKKSDPVVPGQRVEARVPAPAPARAEAQNIPVDIVFQDAELAVVNKQPGLVVHPAPGHPDGTLVNALLHHVRDLSGVGGTLRPGIVHRLDRDTSGLIVVAKTDRAHRALSEALKARRVRRVYLAAIWGTLGEPRLEVDRPIGRHPRDRVCMAVVPEGRPALTRFRHLESWPVGSGTATVRPAASLCEAELGTGRTHQIRVHAAAVGHPVVGDTLYGAGREL
ncbi:MAG: RluA family pseudouridine synthase, partial [Gemmatimonadetes bacterium]|nr:RluA family pseudouridine synthase [Gemmatimonadota bacterium]